MGVSKRYPKTKRLKLCPSKCDSVISYVANRGFGLLQLTTSTSDVRSDGDSFSFVAPFHWLRRDQLLVSAARPVYVTSSCKYRIPFCKLSPLLPALLLLLVLQLCTVSSGGVAPCRCLALSGALVRRGKLSVGPFSRRGFVAVSVRWRELSWGDVIRFDVMRVMGCCRCRQVDYNSGACPRNI